LWSLRCPAGARHGPPRTPASSSDRSLREMADFKPRSLRQPAYEVGGKQFVLIAAGGGKWGSPSGGIVRGLRAAGRVGEPVYDGKRRSSEGKRAFEEEPQSPNSRDSALHALADSLSLCCLGLQLRSLSSLFLKFGVSGSNSAFAGLIGGLFGVRFEFVFEARSCVFNNVMASLVYFLVYFHLPLGASAGTFQPNHAPRRSRGTAHDNVSV
jgi:hypothetical protein